MNKHISKFKVIIQGDSPLIIHKWTSEKTAPIDYNDEWKKTTYIDDKGYLILPIMNITACMYNGGKSIKKGRISMSRLIYPSIIAEPFQTRIRIDNKPITLADIETNGWTSTAGVVVGTSRIERIRTTLPPGWTIEFYLTLVSNLVTPNDIKDVLDNAGFVAGLGDSRPSAPKKPGPYGRFEVVLFEQVKS